MKLFQIQWFSIISPALDPTASLEGPRSNYIVPASTLQPNCTQLSNGHPPSAISGMRADIKALNELNFDHVFSAHAGFDEKCNSSEFSLSTRNYMSTRG